MKENPIIIIGMHRSGTSVLTRVLEQAGVFFGKKKDENDEAIFFQRLNIWMLSQANATWDSPYNARFLGDGCKQTLLRVAESHLRSMSRVQFIGTTRLLKYKDIRDLDFRWGWKDPRNTFTLPIWAGLFPGAKIIHIYRNPIDVAHSLRERELAVAKGPRTVVDRIKEGILKGNVSYLCSPRLFHLEEGIRLWMEYAETALAIEKMYGANCLSIKYEALLADPASYCKTVCDFIGIPPLPPESLKQINSSRRYAFIKNPEMVEAYNQVKNEPLMVRLGYNTID